jgi:transcriptional regulator with XRE-family HTH domain
MGYSFGHKLRKYRTAQKMSQMELASKIGVSNSRVSNWEQGLNRPDVDMLANICNVLSVSPSELLDIHISPCEITGHERSVITQYRLKPELQHAINILLDVEDDS